MLTSILTFFIIGHLIINTECQQFCRQIEDEAEFLFRDALMIDRNRPPVRNTATINEYCR